jgi:hypothetical protein
LFEQNWRRSIALRTTFDRWFGDFREVFFQNCHRKTGQIG